MFPEIAYSQVFLGGGGGGASSGLDHSGSETFILCIYTCARGVIFKVFLVTTDILEGYQI